MRSLVLPGVLVVMGAGASSARAEYVARPDPPPVHLALSVNPPLRWADSGALGASLYAGLAEHQAIRANVATYEFAGNVAGDLLSIAAGGDGDESSNSGRITDIGVGWTYYPRRLWDGFVFEAGVLRRTRDQRVEDWFASPEVLETRTTTYAGRGLIGWSWLMGQHIFISAAVGLSIGYESGTETTDMLFHEGMRRTTEVRRIDVAGEGLLRIGVAFDM